MYRQNNHKYRKPDFLVVLVTLVGVALAATMTLHVHALSSVSSHEPVPMISQFKRCSGDATSYPAPPDC